MRAKGFSFACPSPATNEDEAFERFRKIARVAPSKVHNPWPQLARFENFRQARTNPLLLTCYLPSTDLDLYGDHLEERLTHAHEIGHLVSNKAPAKVLAGLLLSRAFDSLLVLLHGFIWDSKMEKSWFELVKINAQLSAICRSISLPEELLATAGGFEVYASLFSEELDPIVAKYTKLSPYEGLEVVREKEKAIVTKYTRVVLRPKIWTQNSRFLVNHLPYALLG